MNVLRQTRATLGLLSYLLGVTLAGWLAFADASVAQENAASSGVMAPAQRQITCREIVVNSQLDVVEFGANRGTAEPWTYLDPIIYFFKEGDGSGLAYDGYSLVLPDGDAGDPTPTQDILSQVVRFPGGLESATVAYQRAMLDANATDKVYGELWRLTSEGEVDLGNPGMYRVTRWPVTESNKVYREETIALDESVLNQVRGREIALLLRTQTDGGGASDAEKEWVLFDDVSLTACGDIGRIYAPVVLRN